MRGRTRRKAIDVQGLPGRLSRIASVLARVVPLI